MKQLHFATTNKGKFLHLQKPLASYDIELIHEEIDLPEPRSDDLKIIARAKVLTAFSILKKPCIAIDAGFFIHSLNNFPRAFVNFALDTVKVDGILKLAERQERVCEFRDCLAYMDETLDEPLFFESAVKGELAREPRGTLKPYNWSELHRIFIPERYTKTFAEMEEQEYLDFREQRNQESMTHQFGRWFSQRKVLPGIIERVGFDFRWDNQKVWSLHYPIEEVPLTLLSWHFEVPFWNTEQGYYDLSPNQVLLDKETFKKEYDRIMQADLTYPIDIMENKGQWLILDGLHRLVKAKSLEYDMIKVRKIPRSEIPNILKK